MPVRIYDIAKKLGIESKEVLAKAKELGISAKVPSSQLDKITAEFLESHFRPSDPMPGAIRILSAPSTSVSSTLQVLETATPPTAGPIRPQITMTATGGELYRLIERILDGEIQLRLDVCEMEGTEPLRLCLARAQGALIADRKPNHELPQRAEIDERTKSLLRLAYSCARYHSGSDWVNLADFGNALKKEDSTFQPQQFGERSLGSLLRRIADVFEIRADERNPIVYYVREKPRPMSTPSQVPEVLAAEVKPISATLPAVLPTLARGRIHNLKLGFGFILPDDGSENLFFHATEVVGCTIFELQPGEPVEYEPGMNEKGPCARKVRRLL